MCTQAQLNTILRAVYAKASALFGSTLDAVILYGSYARGDYDADSDIDVMLRVRLDKATLATHQWDVSVFSSRLGLEHGIVVSIHLQDCETFEKYCNDMPFFQNVMKDGVQVVA